MEAAVRVNLLSPGQIAALIQEQLFDEETKRQFKSLIPRGKMGRPEEIATVALFLASEDSSFVNWVELFCRRRHHHLLTGRDCVHLGCRPRPLAHKHLRTDPERNDSGLPRQQERQDDYPIGLVALSDLPANTHGQAGGPLAPQP